MSRPRNVVRSPNRFRSDRSNMIWRLRGARLRRAASHSACSAARRPTGAATSFRAVASAPHPSARAPTRFRQAAPNALARAPKIRRGAPIQPAFLQRLLVGGQGRATAAPFHQDCFLPLASSKRFLNVDRVRARLMRAVIGETKANRPPRRPPATAGGILRPGNSLIASDQSTFRPRARPPALDEANAAAKSATPASMTIAERRSAAEATAPMTTGPISRPA